MKYSLTGFFLIIGIGFLSCLVLFWVNPASILVGIGVVATFLAAGLYLIRIPTTNTEK